MPVGGEGEGAAFPELGWVILLVRGLVNFWIMGMGEVDKRLTRVSGNWTFRSPTATAGGISERSLPASVFSAAAGATLPFLGVPVAARSTSVGLLILPTLCAATERRLFEFPKLLMRLKKRLVRLPPPPPPPTVVAVSSETMDAAPEELMVLGEKAGISSVGGGIGTTFLVRPQDLRREEAEWRVR